MKGSISGSPAALSLRGASENRQDLVAFGSCAKLWARSGRIKPKMTPAAKGIDLHTVERWFFQNLNYEPE
ncbi:MAG: hypothetical protein OEV99_09910 [Nitrospira sp.]|nr:hypothetical protein [Nitrospira sp.]MDH4370151.1 hypothetical protein [Nitrospira sp.]MDH5725086.1 hypothetical protein [Nitrospira sp.]